MHKHGEFISEKPVYFRIFGTIGVCIGLAAGIIKIWEITIPLDTILLLKTAGITFGCLVGIIAIWLKK